MLVVLALAASANDMVGEGSRPDGLISQIQIKNGIIISNLGWYKCANSYMVIQAWLIIKKDK